MQQTKIQPIMPAASRALSSTRRQRIEDRIERLISVLDAQDAPSEDRENSGDDEPDGDGEPSLGWGTDKNQERALKNCLVGNCPVFGPDCEDDDSDLEPSLGSFGGTFDGDYSNQERWAWGGDDEREHDAGDEGSRHGRGSRSRLA